MHLFLLTHCASRTVRDGDVVFVPSEDVEQFAIDIFPKINGTKIILITHDGDRTTPMANGRSGN